MSRNPRWSDKCKRLALYAECKTSIILNNMTGSNSSPAFSCRVKHSKMKIKENMKNKRLNIWGLDADLEPDILDLILFAVGNFNQAGIRQ